ncbi:hypothetical protein Hanom_Chr16g01456141 [Helianthus anomalus]
MVCNLSMGSVSKKIVDFSFLSQRFYVLHFNLFVFFTFNPKVFIFCNLTQTHFYFQL